MHKALIGLILAATAMTPAAVQAQERGDRFERTDVADRFRQVARERSERREARTEQRSRRSEARQERRQQPQAQRQVRRERAERREERSERRSGSRTTDSGYRSGWNGPDDPRLREHRQRYERVGRRNAVRHGARDQARDAIRDADTRRERRELIRERRETAGDRRDRNDRRDRWRDRDNDRSDRWRDRDDRRDRWDRGWRNDRRYDWNRYRYSNRHLYRLPRYYSPLRNHRYSRFSIGVHIGRPFYNQRYWLSNPWQYRLPAAPYGTQWVRYYNDVLLVDTHSGEVLDVIYDFFW